MIKSQGWDWKVVKGDFNEIWKTPCIESYYLLNRWQDKKDFLDLGCGRGRHSIQFGRAGFNVYAFDISEEAIKSCKEWAESEGLTLNYQQGDMLELPYDDESIDCIMCRNVINHTDTLGVKKVISEIHRVLRSDGECFLTFCSKDSWAYKMDWPKVDENTMLKMQEGPEYGVPHFYADYDLLLELFKDFKIENLEHVGSFYEHDDGRVTSYHFHLLIKKV